MFKFANDSPRSQFYKKYETFNLFQLIFLNWNKMGLSHYDWNIVESILASRPKANKKTLLASRPKENKKTLLAYRPKVNKKTLLASRPKANKKILLSFRPKVNKKTLSANIIIMLCCLLQTSDYWSAPCNIKILDVFSKKSGSKCEEVVIFETALSSMRNVWSKSVIIIHI